jgi:hypothetical protein
MSIIDDLTTLLGKINPFKEQTLYLYKDDPKVYNQPRQTPIPTPISTPIPTLPPEQGGFHIPGVPQDIAQTIGQVFTAQGVPMNATLSAQILSHPYGPQVGGNWGRGENPEFKTDLDIPNRINPRTGKWDDSAPIKQILNPFTGKYEDSVDRGLWRINNATFYDYQRRMGNLLSQYGINSWEDMKDPLKNTIMAKIILQHQGPGAWRAAPANLYRLTQQ